jgi:predicted permease
MNYFFSIADKILFVILVMATGILAKKMKWISEEGEKDMSRLMIDFIWPSMIFSSIIRNLSAGDILSNLWLPVLALVTHLTGYALGLLVARLAGYAGERRKIFLFHATMNNFLVMALPFAQFFLPGKGAALLAVANLGSIILLWTLGVTIVAGNLGLRRTVRNVFSPGMIATVAAVFFVLTGLGRFVPAMLLDALHVVGQPTLLFGLMIAGTQIYKLGRSALKFDGWNILVGLVRNIVVPGVLFGLALLLRGVVGREALIIFMLVNITPASVNSVTLAMKYDTAPHLAAEGVIFTHLLAVGTMLGYVMLIERFII